MTKALETPIETTKERWAEAEINRKQNFGNSAPQ
jgi:hypothetical protein